MSLRMRLIISYTLIVVLCFSLAAVAVSVVLRAGRDQLVMARLDDLTRPVYVQVATLARGQATLSQVMTNLREQAQKNNIYILLAEGQTPPAELVLEDNAPSPGQRSSAVWLGGPGAEVTCAQVREADYPTFEEP